MPAPRSAPLLFLFTKPARPGRVKTRLIGDLTAQQAADLHAAFLADLLDRLAGGSFELRIAWALDPGEVPPPTAHTSERQEGADLGERLFLSLAGGAKEGRPVAALGSDHPTLPLERVEEAFARLEAGAQVVVGPAEDGGYYLIALRPEAVRRRLFEGIAWSTGEVLAATLDRCREEGLRCELLPVGADVDTAEDLLRLARELAETGGEGRCPRTRDLLAEWGRLNPVGAAS